MNSIIQMYWLPGYLKNRGLREIEEEREKIKMKNDVEETGKGKKADPPDRVSAARGNI